MAIKRLAITGYGQIELNNVAFRRDGRIEAQCALDATDFETAVAENGMLLAVNNVARTVCFPKEGGIYPIALNYTTEHMYDERANALKDFALKRGEFLPRLGYLAEGDKFTTNCIAYDDGEFADDETLKEAMKKEALATTPLYGTTCENGAIKITKTAPTGVKLLVVAGTTMPDSQFGVKFQALK